MSARAAGARRGWEHRRERDERALVNIPPDLVPLWDKVKGAIRGRTPDARAEVFLEYAEAHPHEAIEAMQASADRKLASMLGAYREPPPELIPAAPTPIAPPVAPRSRVYLVCTAKGAFEVRTDAPRFYDEHGTTYAYWRGAGAFPVARGRVQDAGKASVRLVPEVLADEARGLDAQIADLQRQRRDLLARAMREADPVPSTDAPF